MERKNKIKCVRFLTNHMTRLFLVFLLADLDSMSLNYFYLFSFTCPALKDKVDKAHSCLSVCLSFPYVRNALEGMDLLGCYKRYTADYF